jgi:hypothetical protein
LAPAAYDAASETGGRDEGVVGAATTRCVAKNTPAAAVTRISFSSRRLPILTNTFLKKSTAKAYR